MSNLARWVCIGVQKLGLIEMVVSSIATAALVVIILLQVFCRYLLNFPLLWPDEIAMLLFVWITFVGAAALHKSNRHIAITYFRERWRPAVIAIIDLVLSALLIGFFIYIFIYGIEVVRVQMKYRQAILALPRAFFTLPLLICTVSMFLVQVTILTEKAINLFQNLHIPSEGIHHDQR